MTRYQKSVSHFAFGLWMLGGLAGVFGVWIGLDRWSSYRAKAVESQVRKTSLKQLLGAINEYHEKYGSFPPAYTENDRGEKLHSWRVLLLPFLGEDALYSQFDLSQPWSSPRNLPLVEQIPAVYRPSSRQQRVGVTEYAAIVDSHTIWPGPYCTRYSDIKDRELAILAQTPTADRLWTEPADIALRQAVDLMVSDQSGVPGTYFGFLGGRVQWFKPPVNRDLAYSLLSRDGTKSHPAFRSGTEFRKSRLPELKPISDLRLTEIVVHPAIPFAEKKNSLYCCTFRMAWEEIRRAQGGTRVQLMPGQSPPPLVDLLDDKPIPVGVLSSGTFLSLSGKSTDVGRAAKAAYPEFDFSAASFSRPQSPLSLSFFAALKRSLPFLTPFPRADRHLDFRGSDREYQTRCFGIIPGSTTLQVVQSGKESDLKQQVQLHYDASDDDFIMELSTSADSRDRIILAKMPKADSLAHAWEVVSDRMQRAKRNLRRNLDDGDHLMIPVVQFHLSHSVPELNGLQIAPGGRLKRGAILADNTQIIGMVLDEIGVEVESWTEIHGVEAMDGDFEFRDPVRIGPRRLLFDRPFLIAVLETNAPEPYLMAWIETGELLSLDEMKQK